MEEEVHVGIDVYVLMYQVDVPLYMTLQKKFDLQGRRETSRDEIISSKDYC